MSARGDKGVPAVSAGELWSHYVSHFSFTQLGWLFSVFNDEADDDVIRNKEVLYNIIEEWLKHQWEGIMPKPNDDLISQLIDEGHPLPLDFHNFVHYLTKYQDMHIELEECAGFHGESVDSLREIYDQHNTSSAGQAEGLKGKELFSVLEELDIKFHSKEERQWYVETVTRFDRDASGSINFLELCQIIRKVINMEEEKVRKRQFELIKQSALPFHEVEDWNSLFISKDEDGKGELMLTEVKSLITGLGVKWDKEMSDQIVEWIGESDQNKNGTIDFGEFCLVISKMWAANLHDVRGAARDLLVKDRTVSLKCIHNTYVAAAKDGSMSARKTEAGDAETFVMKRNNNGTVCMLGRNGKFIAVNESSLRCNGSEAGEPRATPFKITTLEDERITLQACTSMGGHLFVNLDGEVLVSDGNPADAPYTVFSLVSHEELHKKCWSKSMQLAKIKPTSLAEARKNSKGNVYRTPRETEDPMSPGMQVAVSEMDNALAAKSFSARGGHGIGPPI